VQRKARLSYYFACWFIAGLCLGCHSGPVFTDDAYRAIEREADRNISALAVTGADIAAGVGRIDDRAARVQSELNSLETAIGESGVPEGGKSALLLHASIAREETAALTREVSVLRQDTGRLNEQLAEQREIAAALSEEHDRRETAGAEAKEDLAVTKEKLAKVSGQRNLAVVIAAALALAIIGYIVIRVLRFLRVIPV
jgi:septal ring factor EnvC (AmiA/AmiB activator)